MEKKGWLRAEWRVTENKRRAKYYGLTDLGRAELASQVKRWAGSSWAVDTVLEAGDA